MNIDFNAFINRVTSFVTNFVKSNPTIVNIAIATIALITAAFGCYKARNFFKAKKQTNPPQEDQKTTQVFKEQKPSSNTSNSSVNSNIPSSPETEQKIELTHFTKDRPMGPAGRKPPTRKKKESDQTSTISTPTSSPKTKSPKKKFEGKKMTLGEFHKKA